MSRWYDVRFSSIKRHCHLYQHILDFRLRIEGRSFRQVSEEETTPHLFPLSPVCHKSTLKGLKGTGFDHLSRQEPLPMVPSRALNDSAEA